MSMSAPSPSHRTGLAPMQVRFLLVAAVLSTIAAIQLLVLSDATASYFAWTVNPPIAAAFFGAGFVAIAAAAVRGLRVGESRQIESFVPVAIVATGSILIASLLHLDRFHLSSPDLAPLVAAWVWLAVYIVVPLALLAYWIRALGTRGPARAGPARRPIPPALRAGLAALCIAAVILAAIAFISPTTLRWPYALTPLTARMTGAFLAALVAAVIVILLVDDLARLRVAPATLVVFGAVALLNLARFSGTVTTTGAGIWIYGGLFSATIVLGAAVVILAERPAARGPAPTSAQIQR